MEDHRLGDLLRELPREHARPGFTARVLKQLDAPAERDLRWNPRMALAAMTAAAVMGITAGVLTNRPAGPQAIETAEARQILQELRAEHGRLERELQTLSEPPVMYLGGNEEVDLVLDLRNVHDDAEGMVPAAFHNQTF